MKLNLFSAALAIGFFSFLSTGHLLAGFIFEFESGGVQKTLFEVEEGNSLGIDVYFKQTESENRLVTNGLTSLGVKMEYSSVAGFAKVTGATKNSSFGNSDLNTGTANSYSLVASVGIDPAVKGARIQLGTFTFQSGLVGNVTTIKLVDPSVFADIKLDNVVGNLDSTVFGSGIENAFSVSTITAVPEPSTLILVGLAASSMGAAAWRKRKRLLTRMPLNG